MKKVKLNNVWVGDNEPCYFIAEIGGNFKTVEEGKIIIDSAMRAGANAVKFQTFEAETVTTKKNMFYLEAVKGKSQYEVLKESEISKDVQKEACEYAQKKGITIFSAPSHLKDLETLDMLGIDIYKIGSDLACHVPLLRKIAKKDNPILLSTGMCTLEEVRTSVEIILSEGNDNLTLFHCVADYPTKKEEVNLRAIETLKKEFKLPVGFSDHTIGPEVSIAAATLGANLIERHFRHENCFNGPDYALSSDEKEFKYIIDTVRMIEVAKGNGIKMPSKSEMKNKVNNRVSIVSLVDICKGKVIKEDMVDIRRPGYGIQPKYLDIVLGRTAKKDIKSDEPITWDMI